MLSMRGDRHVEYGFAKTYMPKGDGKCLDIGPGLKGRMAQFAIGNGWSVVGVDLAPCKLRNPQFTFVRGDFLTIRLGIIFGLVLNVSSIEHFGLPGRYGITKYEADADLKGMARARLFMDRGAKMILTIPVGVDATLIPFHRVYGRDRLPKLLDGFRLLRQQYWHKEGNIDKYVPCSREQALGTQPLLEPKHYYAIGAFILEKKL